MMQKEEGRIRKTTIEAELGNLVWLKQSNHITIKKQHSSMWLKAVYLLLLVVRRNISRAVKRIRAQNNKYQSQFACLTKVQPYDVIASLCHNMRHETCEFPWEYKYPQFNSRFSLVVCWHLAFIQHKYLRTNDLQDLLQVQMAQQMFVSKTTPRKSTVHHGMIMLCHSFVDHRQYRKAYYYWQGASNREAWGMERRRGDVEY